MFELAQHGATVLAVNIIKYITDKRFGNVMIKLLTRSDLLLNHYFMKYQIVL